MPLEPEYLKPLEAEYEYTVVDMERRMVAFNDRSRGEITSWSWDFGDGATSEEQHPIHQYGEGRGVRGDAQRRGAGGKGPARQGVRGDGQVTAAHHGMPHGRRFPVKTGGSRTMDEIVRAGGYDGVHSFITQENFPVAPRPQADVLVELIGLGRIATSAEAVAELGMHGLRRPTPEEAVCFGEQHPDAQRHRPIVWPHEPFAHEDGSRRLLVHFGGTGYRSLDLYVDSAWGAYCVFAGVREQGRRMMRNFFTDSRRGGLPARL